MVQIGFNPTNYTVSEDMGGVTFFIEKQGTNERDVTVSFSTVDGNATGEIAMSPGSGDYDGSATGEIAQSPGSGDYDIDGRATGREATQVV